MFFYYRYGSLFDTSVITCQNSYIYSGLFIKQNAKNSVVKPFYSLLKSTVIPPFPLFAYTSLNLVKQNVDLTGFCYILLIFVEPRNST